MGIGVGLFARHGKQMTAEALADTRVVVVNGARQVGKSTLAELIVARSAGARELYLDDEAVRAAAQADPSAFVRHAGTVIGVEVKAAETVRSEDFRGLRHLAIRLGDRFRAGIVLYAGEQQLSFGDRLTALPMAALWTLDGSAS
jgi:predicted AAA+ superfamily ATPase